MTKWLRRLASGSRNRAKRAQFAHDLPADHGMKLYQQQGGKCAISGLQFSLEEFAGVLVKHPFAPSFDRISSQRGYTTENVRLVCIAVNFGMGQWGQELYLTFARAAFEHNVRTLPTAETEIVKEPVDPHKGEKDEVLTWSSLQRERIAAAEAIASVLSGEPLAQQRRRIASLKRNLTLGPAGLKAASLKRNITLGETGLKAAAAKAMQTRIRRVTER